MAALSGEAPAQGREVPVPEPPATDPPPLPPGAGPGSSDEAFQDLRSAPSAGTLLVVGYATDRGRVNPSNEDCIGVVSLAGVFGGQAAPTLGLYMVADGVGGAAAGRAAAQRAIQVVGRHLVQNVMLPFLDDESRPLPEALRSHVQAAIEAANSEVHGLSQELGYVVGCTLVVALVLDGRTVIANLGDCRAYAWDGSRLRQVTTDHSVVFGLVSSGQLEPEALYTHPDRHTVYRSIGYAPTVEVEVFEMGLAPGDALVLCSDGLWKALRDEGISALLAAHPEPQAACEQLLRRAVDSGAEDNASVVMVRLILAGETQGT